jgi:hypothetical protein
MEPKVIAAYAGAIIGVLGIPSAFFTAKNILDDLHVKSLNQSIVLCEVQKLKEHAVKKQPYTDEMECYRKVLGIGL